MIQGVTPVLRFVPAVDENILGNVKSCQGTPQAGCFLPSIPAISEWQGFNHDEIHVGVWCRLATGMRTEKDYLLRVYFLYYSFYHLAQSYLIYRFHEPNSSIRGLTNKDSLLIHDRTLSPSSSIGTRGVKSLLFWYQGLTSRVQAFPTAL